LCPVSVIKLNVIMCIGCVSLGYSVASFSLNISKKESQSLEPIFQSNSQASKQRIKKAVHNLGRTLLQQFRFPSYSAEVESADPPWKTAFTRQALIQPWIKTPQKLMFLAPQTPWVFFPGGLGAFHSNINGSIPIPFLQQSQLEYLNSLSFLRTSKMTFKKGSSLTRKLYYALPPSITGFAYGWENASMGGILAMPQFLTYFNTPSAYRQGAMTAALIAGEFGGSLLIGYLLSDRLGRRLTILASVIVYLVGQAIIVASQNQAMFIAGRVVNGLGAGGLFQTMSLYATLNLHVTISWLTHTC
jgi:hypothetical protein